MNKEVLDYYNEYLDYNEITGNLIYKKIPNGVSNSRLNCDAGSIEPKGYRVVTIKCESYKVHRLAWFIKYGEIPTTIDHINGNKLDNRICNLRNVTQADNTRNACKRKDNTSGQTGVCFSKIQNQWQSSISINKKRIHLGYFDNLKDAIDARKQAEVDYNYHENHGR